MLRISSETGGKLACRRDWLLHSLVVRRAAPSSLRMIIRCYLPINQSDNRFLIRVKRSVLISPMVPSKIALCTTANRPIRMRLASFRPETLKSLSSLDTISSKEDTSCFSCDEIMQISQSSEAAGSCRMTNAGRSFASLRSA